jgi:quercetin dioxygenase-like cupin family protein
LELLMSGFFRGPDDGDAHWFGGALFVQKVASADASGQLAVMEMMCPAGLAVPGHIHPGEDEIFYVLEGELSVFCGEDQWTATAGSLVFLPRDVQHRFTVSAASAAKVLVVVGPAHFDAHVAEAGQPTADHQLPA